MTADNGKKSVNGLTVHVLGGDRYNPTVYDVGPGVSVAKYDPTKRASQTGTAGVSHAIQNAIDAAASSRRTNGLIVVHPNTPTAVNPRGAYYENLVVYGARQAPGHGAGGFQGTSSTSPWVARHDPRRRRLRWGHRPRDRLVHQGGRDELGRQPDGQRRRGRLPARAVNQHLLGGSTAYTPAIDGFDIRGGDQQGFPGNINDLTGQPTGLPANIVTQGGAVFANAYVRQLQVTNNVVENNGGGYGTIRIGTPELAAPGTNQHNEKVRIADNRIVQNAGTNLAGAIGLFAGSDGYQVSGNDICGNFALEYGGGVSVYGYSPGGSIHHNRVTLNNSNDEGGGIMIAGQLPATPGALSPGTGPVDIYANLIQGNLANDDGGGIRFLMAGNFEMNVHDNMIVNNVSTHEGGGVGINDAPNVRIYNNTIMKNLTTATAVTSNGTAAPAGVSTSANSDMLQATLPATSPSFSRPLLFNNILWDNRAGTRAGTTVSGLGLAGDVNAVDHWDVGVADATGTLSLTGSVIQQSATQHPFTSSSTNRQTDPKVVTAFDLSVSFATWRQNPAFVDATVVAFEKPADQMGDYHLQACTGSAASPACNLGAASSGGVTVATVDIDGDSRPSGGGVDSGADEVVGAAPPAPQASFSFSTAGNANPPGVTGTADNSDIYAWNGTAFSRTVDVTTASTKLPGTANVDGYSMVDATHYYLSFADEHGGPRSGHRPGRRRRLLERLRLEPVLRRQRARTLRGRPRRQRDQRAGHQALLRDRRQRQPPGCHGDAGQQRHLHVGRHEVRPGLRRHDPGCARERQGRRVLVDLRHPLLRVLRSGHEPAHGRVRPGRGHRRVHERELVGLVRRDRPGHDVHRARHRRLLPTG